MPAARQGRLLVAGAGPNRLYLLKTSLLPVDALVDECEEARIGRQGVHEGDRIVHTGTELLERITCGHLGALEVQLLEHRRFAEAMGANAHHTQQRQAPGQREGEHVSGGEAGERPLRRTQALPGGLRTGQLRASFLERRAALRHQLRVLSFPHRQVGAGSDDGEGAIANVGFQPANLRLRHGEGDQRDAIGFRQILRELFERLPRRVAIVDAVLQQLTIVVAYIARHIVREQAGPPRSQTCPLSRAYITSLTPCSCTSRRSGTHHHICNRPSGRSWGSGNRTCTEIRRRFRRRRRLSWSTSDAPSVCVDVMSTREVSHPGRRPGLNGAAVVLNESAVRSRTARRFERWPADFGLSDRGSAQGL